MAVMDIVVRAQDQASDVLESIGDRGSQAAGWLEKNWLAVSAAAAGVGLALEGVNRRNQDMEVQSRRAARAVGLSSEEMRQLAGDTTDATFPLGDVLDLFELGTRMGIDNAEALQGFAQTWDMVGDATGVSATKLAEGSVALRHLGIDVNNTEDAMAAFGFLTAKTTVDVDEFMMFVRRAGEDLVDLGFDIDETAAVLGILEQQGYDGREAIRIFGQAASEADGDTARLLSTLGITEGQFEATKDEVAASSGVIEEFAEDVKDTRTPIQELEARVQGLMFEYGGLFQSLQILSPVLMAMPGILGGITAAKKALALVTSGSLIPAIGGAIASAWSFTAALLANPITWVVLLIVGLVAAIIYLWRNWDEVSQWLMNSWETVKQTATDIFESIMAFFAGLPDRVYQIFLRLVTFVLELFMRYSPLGFIISNWNEIISFLSGLPSRVWAIMLEVIARVTQWASRVATTARSAANNLISGFMGMVRGLPGMLWNTLLATARRLLDIGGTLWSYARNAASQLWSGFKGALGISSPSYMEEALMDVASASENMVKEVEDDVRRLRRIDPELGFAHRFQNDRARTFEGVIPQTRRVIIEHQNAPDTLDEETQRQMIREMLRDPQIRRDLDQVGYENVSVVIRPLGART